MTRQDALGGQLLTAVLTVDPRFFLTHFLAETANNMKKNNRKITELQRQNALVPEGRFMVPGLALGASSERKSSLRCVRPLFSSLPSSSSTLRAEV